MKIQLISPPIDKEYCVDEGYERLPPPIGLLSIASYVKEHNLSEIEVIDGNRCSLEQILEKINADIVGCTSLFTSHKSALTILNEAKKKGAKTVIGGTNASNLAEIINKKHAFIDHVVVGDGETAFNSIVSNSIGKGINFGIKEKLNELPFLDLKFAKGMEEYDSRKSTYSEDGLTPFPTSFIRGCIKGCIKEKRCPYCAIYQEGIRTTNPERFWEQIRRLKQEYGIRYFFETGDDFIVSSYPEKLAKAKPAGLDDIKFRIYARPQDIKDTTVLKKIGVSEIFLGIEHISSEMTSYIGKKHSKERIINIMKKLENDNIEVHLAFLFGLIPETEKTAVENAHFSNELTKRFKNIKRLLYTHASPLAGSGWYRTLLANQDLRSEYLQKTEKNLIDDDYPDYALLQKLSLKYFSHISYERLKEIYTNSLEKLKKNIPGNRIAGFGQALRN